MMRKMAKPTQGMKVEARKGLDWRKEHGRGGTRIGAERANQILNNENLYKIYHIPICKIVFFCIFYYFKFNNNIKYPK